MGEQSSGTNEFSSNKIIARQKNFADNGAKDGKSVYSHSRLSTYEQCPLKFRYAYIDKVETEAELSIEAFLGNRVHEALEKLYTDLKFEKLNSLAELLGFFDTEWKKHFNEKIVIVRKEYDDENYRLMGEKYLTDYYNRYNPFNQSKTIGLEMKIVIRLDAGGEFMLQGFIDRLSFAGDGVYEIHDYKTSNSLPEQDKIDADRQLALYKVAIKEQYRDCSKVVLIWHYLAFDKELRSERTTEQLELLKEETINLIKEIESAKDFPPRESALCQWCEFRPICPRWSHLYKVEGLESEQFKKEDGVRLVDEYSVLKIKEKELADELERISARILSYSEQQNIDKLFGSDSKVTVWKKYCVKFPGKMDAGYADLVKELRNLSAWEEFNTLDKWKLEKAFEELDMAPDAMAAIAKYGKKELLKKLYLGKR
jgi:putative RecB family exonuclease